MTLVAEKAQDGGQDNGPSFTPRRVAIAAGALGLATLAGMALGSVPALTQGTSRVSFAMVGNVSPASASDQASLEEQARQAAVQQLARAMLKKSLADQAAAMKDAAPQETATAPAPAPTVAAPAQDVAVTTTGANASAALADKAETTVPSTKTASLPAPVIPTPPPTEQTASLDPQDMERLAGKAAEAIRNGDIASARLVLEHAARAGDATALYALAETYDPRVLVKLKVQGMQGEPDTARNLYQRALDKGVEEARGRL
ncbi:MAG: hypothetical protein JWN07_693 [Hyphomicrobiales bacterium]|nr:hypothetical protein [Hyphomicrobiales bacterium]